MSSSSPASLPDSSMPMGQHPPQRRQLIERLRWLSLTLLVSLIALGCLWELTWAPLAGGSGALAWKVLPLTLGLAGVLKHKLYTFRWLSLLIWLYVTEGLVRATSDKGLSQTLAMVETVLSVALFAACALYIRLRLRALPAPAGSADSAADQTSRP